MKIRHRAAVLPVLLTIGALSPASAGATAGPIGRWMLDETSGTTAFDASGNGNAGTVVGAAQGLPGRIGTAYGFANTSSTRVDIPMTAALRPANLTLSAWVNPASLSCPAFGACAAVSSETFNGTVGYGLRVFGDGTLQWCGYGGVYFGACTYSAPGAIGINTWTSIVGEYDGARLISYVNGVEVTNVAVGPFTYDANLTLRIGGSPFGMTWDGRIDDVRVYDRAVSPSEVAQLANPVPVPATKDDCKGNGWQAVARPDGSRFKNQGDCIQYVNTGK